MIHVAGKNNLTVLGKSKDRLCQNLFAPNRKQKANLAKTSVWLQTIENTGYEETQTSYYINFLINDPNYR